MPRRIEYHRCSTFDVNIYSITRIARHREQVEAPGAKVPFLASPVSEIRGRTMQECERDILPRNRFRSLLHGIFSSPPYDDMSLLALRNMNGVGGQGNGERPHHLVHRIVRKTMADAWFRALFLYSTLKHQSSLGGRNMSPPTKIINDPPSSHRQPAFPD